jgi:hypothetical protein
MNKPLGRRTPETWELELVGVGVTRGLEAQLVPTQMVKLKAFGNRPVEVLVDVPVGGMTAPVCPNAPIATAAHVEQPLPAARLGIDFPPISRCPLTVTDGYRTALAHDWILP